MRTTTCTLSLLSLMCAVFGCGSDGPAASRAPVRAPAVAPVALSDVMASARYTFRRDGEAWVSGDATFVASASAAGLAFTPYHHARAPDPRGGLARATRGATARIATTSVGRGDPLAFGPSAPAAQRDGAVTLLRGAAVERFLVTRAGAEQSWAFAERPVGEGDLVVRVSVTGLAYRGATGGGAPLRRRRDGPRAALLARHLGRRRRRADGGPGGLRGRRGGAPRAGAVAGVVALPRGARPDGVT